MNNTDNKSHQSPNSTISFIKPILDFESIIKHHAIQQEQVQSYEHPQGKERQDKEDGEQQKRRTSED